MKDEELECWLELYSFLLSHLQVQLWVLTTNLEDRLLQPLRICCAVAACDLAPIGSI